MKQTVNEKIKHTRLGRRMTQTQLCKRAGISLATLSYIENGQKIPSQSVLLKLSKALDVSVSYWFTDYGSRVIDCTGLYDSEIQLVQQLVNTLRKAKGI